MGTCTGTYMGVVLVILIPNQQISILQFVVFTEQQITEKLYEVLPCVAPSSGGGGTSSDMPWRDKDEDYLHWAYRAMRYDHTKHYPGNKLKKSKSY